MWRAPDSTQRRPNTAALLTGRASRLMLAHREAPGDGCGVVVQRTTAALRSRESTPTTRLTNASAPMKRYWPKSRTTRGKVASH